MPQFIKRVQECVYTSLLPQKWCHTSRVGMTPLVYCFVFTNSFFLFLYYKHLCKNNRGWDYFGSNCVTSFMYDP